MPNYKKGSFAELRDRLVPAIRHTSGEVVAGKRGDWHAKLKRNAVCAYHQYTSGYVDPATGEFYVRDEINIDSTELMTPEQKEYYNKHA